MSPTAPLNRRVIGRQVVQDPLAATHDIPTVLTIGAGGEIGSSICASLAESGFRIVRTQRKASDAGTMDEAGRRLMYELDVTDSKRVHDCLQSVERDFEAPFGIVYVAGCKRDAPLAMLTDAQWREVIDVNLTGAFSVVRAASRSMMAKGCGRIILVGSISGRLGIAGQAAYAASKAGLEAFARVAAIEFGRFGVSVNVVVPGAIDSGMFRTVADGTVKRIVNRTALRRLGNPQDIAAVVRFLLQPEASYITGQSFITDGGLSAS